MSTLTEKPCQSQRDNALDEPERRRIDGNKLAGATNYSELSLSVYSHEPFKFCWIIDFFLNLYATDMTFLLRFFHLY